MGTKLVKRHDRKAQIYQLFNVVGEGRVTVYQLAKILDVKPSQWLRDILNEMVDENVLEVEIQDHRPTIQKRVYKLSHRYKVR